MILQSMLPRGVVAREAQADVDAPLHPREAAQIAKAVPKRQAEYATVRHLAREALASWVSVTRCSSRARAAAWSGRATSSAP